MPEVLEYLGDAMPRAQGDVALMAQSAGEDSDTEWRLVHRQPQILVGCGRVDALGRMGTVGGPEQAQQLEIAVTTPDSRRTPSRISAGSG